MMNGHGAFIGAIHYHPPIHQQHFPISNGIETTVAGSHRLGSIPSLPSHSHPRHHPPNNHQQAHGAHGLATGHSGLQSTSSFGCGASSTFALPLPFRPAPPAADLPADYNTAHHFARPATLTMAAFAQQDEELARLQDLSNKWEPEQTGPLVSELLESNAITTEYANADPIYQAKTANLPQTYAHYRTCRGDGHCGWRAVAFCYFETLVRLGDPYKFQEEITRLRSLRNILNDAGFQEHVYEDFADDAFSLLEEAPAAANGIATVLEAFNDVNRSMSIITYLKLLTSAWMQRYPDQYQAFVSEPIQSYCRSNIEPAVCEIDNVGMSALIDVLIKPAGLAVEILYLDRSAGTEVNMYRYAPGDRPSCPTFRLLYRPGHYDILYKAEDVARPAPVIPAPPTTQQNVFIALAHDTTELTHHRTTYQPEPIEIPGLSFYSGPHGGWPPAFSQYDIAPSPISPAITSPRATASPSYPGVPSHPHDVYIQTVPIPQPTLPTMTLPHHPPIDRGGPFRPSAWEFETSYASQAQHPSLCQTAIFRNSHYNTAHFNNPEFMPEQWQPDSEYTTGDRPRKKSSHSSQ